MPAITFSDFSGGLDRRLPVTVQDSSRLWILRNAHITTGKRIKKRPGLKVISTALGGSVGLAAVAGRLKVFINMADPFTAPPQVDAIGLNIPAFLGPGQHLQRIYAATMFEGFPYVVAEYDPSGVYAGGVSEGNTGGGTPGHVPTPRPPLPGTAL